MENNIYDFIVLTDVFCRYWHQLVDYFAKECYISPGIVSYPRHEVCNSFLMLQEKIETKRRVNIDYTNLCKILKVDDQHL